MFSVANNSYNLLIVASVIQTSISHRTGWLVIGGQMMELQLSIVFKGQSLSTFSLPFWQLVFDLMFIISVSQHGYCSSRNNVWKQPQPPYASLSCHCMLSQSTSFPSKLNHVSYWSEGVTLSPLGMGKLRIKCLTKQNQIFMVCL